MKLVYLTPTLSSPAGMERVLFNKVCWLIKQGGYEITIITTDQGDAPVFYDFPQEVKIIDLGINYCETYSLPPFRRFFRKAQKQKLHRRKLKELLLQERADVTVVLYPSDLGFVYRIKDGSRKIMEFHSHKFFRLKWADGQSGFHRLMARIRTMQDAVVTKRYDRMLVLTHEDASLWGNRSNIKVVPNSVACIPELRASVASSRRVIAVGRYVNQKGFDRLLSAWSMIPSSLRQEWKLDIFGQGPLETELKEMIDRLNIKESASVCEPTKYIYEEYAKSAFLVLSSREEGFGMVLVESMSIGLPVVSFDCQCGPKEIVIDGGGILVPNGDIKALSAAMVKMMESAPLRESYSRNALKVKERFSEEHVMSLYERCLKEW